MRAPASVYAGPRMLRRLRRCCRGFRRQWLWLERPARLGFDKAYCDRYTVVGAVASFDCANDGVHDGVDGKEEKYGYANEYEAGYEADEESKQAEELKVEALDGIFAESVVAVAEGEPDDEG